MPQIKDTSGIRNPTGLDPTPAYPVQYRLDSRSIDTTAEQQATIFNYATEQFQKRLDEVKKSEAINRASNISSTFLKDSIAFSKELETQSLDEARGNWSAYLGEKKESLLQGIDDPVERARLDAAMTEKGLAIEQDFVGGIMKRTREKNIADGLANMNDLVKMASESNSLPQRHVILGDVESTINGLVAAGDIGADDGFKMLDSARRSVQENYLNRLAVEGNPGQALAFLKDDTYSGYIPADRKLALGDSYQNELKRFEAESKAKFKEHQATVYNKTLLSIENGQLPSLDDINNSKVLSDAQKVQLLRATKSMQNDINQANIKMSYAFDGTQPINPDDKEDRKALNNYYLTNILNNPDVPDKFSATAQLAANTGAFPGRFESQASAVFSGGNVNDVKTYIETMIAAEAYGDSGRAAIDALPDKARDFYNLVKRDVQFGGQIDDSIARAREASKIDPSILKSRNSAANDSWKDAAEDVKDLFYDLAPIGLLDRAVTTATLGLVSPFTSDDVIKSPGAKEFMYDAELLYKQAYARTGDSDAAMSDTKRRLSTRYAVSNINNRPEVVRDAPEKYYGAAYGGGYSVKELQSEAEAEVGKLGIERPSIGQNFILYPDMRTQSEAATKLPSYAVYKIEKDDDGAIIYSTPIILPDGSMARFVPDFVSKIKKRKFEQEFSPSLGRRIAAIGLDKEKEPEKYRAIVGEEEEAAIKRAEEEFKNDPRIRLYENYYLGGKK